MCTWRHRNIETENGRSEVQGLNPLIEETQSELLMGFLAKQVAVVTGGRCGIGKGIALGLAVEVAVVCLVRRSTAALEKVKDEAGEVERMLKALINS